MTTPQRPSIAHRVAAEAERIVETLQHTVYQHKTHIDEESGTFNVDCSAFVSYVLERVTPEQYHEIPKEANQNRPRAFKYYEFLASLASESQPGWKQITRLHDAKRGDIIAWRFKEVKPHEDTGHVVIVSARPETLSGGVIAIEVYDSAATPHFDDTRVPDSENSTGVGSGTLHFAIDDSGAPLSVEFGPSHPFLKHKIALGRIEPTLP